MGNGIVTNTDYDQKDSEGTWHRTRQVFRTPVMHPDRIYSYFLREWKTLLIVAVSGTLFNLGQSLCAMRQGQLVDAIADCFPDDCNGGPAAAAGKAILRTTVCECDGHLYADDGLQPYHP